MKRPTADALRIAALWLEIYEGTGKDAQACATVSAWLTEQAAADDLRAECKAAGLPVAAVRAALSRASRRAV